MGNNVKVCPNCHRILSCSCGFRTSKKGTRCCKFCIAEVERKESNKPQIL